ncbi:hypothetical protein [Chondromyces crocatus]|uniref:HEAT repeat domain-containing protein n=1 Tax=Chondromyces crocatus TaxID=52 RepID=A0A0K1ESK4_CHOCO|nr:hypothetical protein [Chondromyces crocatus]AKT43588.1 uncharacterized protein CMC5_078210 [Chondromyces crocatus]
MISEKKKKLILDYLTGRVELDQFFHDYPLEPENASTLAREMFVRAIEERDSDAVEYGFYLDSQFGPPSDYLEILLVLVEADWHQSHEAAVDTLVSMKSPRSVDVLFRAATKPYEYRDYDDIPVIGAKCVRGMGQIRTLEAVKRIGELLNCGDGYLERLAVSELGRVIASDVPESLRTAALDILNEYQPS